MRRPLDENLCKKLRRLLDHPESPLQNPPFPERTLAWSRRGIVHSIYISPQAQKRLYESHGWLDDDAINGLSALLHHRILKQTEMRKQTHKCAVLSTHVFMLVTNDATWEHLFRHCKYSGSWKRPIWIIPIHRFQHWILAVVHHEQKTITFYDSFGFGKNNECDWGQVLQVCSSFTAPFVSLLTFAG